MSIKKIKFIFFDRFSVFCAAAWDSFLMGSSPPHLDAFCPNWRLRMTTYKSLRKRDLGLVS